MEVPFNMAVSVFRLTQIFMGMGESLVLMLLALHGQMDGSRLIQAGIRIEPFIDPLRARQHQPITRLNLMRRQSNLVK